MEVVCFICGQKFESSIKAENKRTLKWLLGKVCELLNICLEEDWKFLETTEDSKCCSKCYQQLTDIQQTYQRLVLIRRSLKTHVANLEKQVQESTECVDNASLRPECANFRRQLSNYTLSGQFDKLATGLLCETKVAVKTEDLTDGSALQIQEYSPSPLFADAGPSVEVESHEEDGCEHDNGHWNDEFLDECDTEQTQSHGEKKRRKIVVIAEEDEISDVGALVTRSSYCERVRINENSARLKRKYSSMQKQRQLSAQNRPKLPTRINGVYKCEEPDCSYTSKIGANFERHLISHLPRKLRPDLITCDQCGKKMVKDSLARHILKAHRPELIEQGRSCPHCGKKFLAYENYEYKIHLERHKTGKLTVSTKYPAKKRNQSDKNRPKLPLPINGVFKCSEHGCFYTSPIGANFERHIISHLPRDQRPDVATCEHCGVKMFENSLPRHILTVHRPELKEEGRSCPDCGKKFFANDNFQYKAHLLRHKTEKPFVCGKCGKGFVTKGYLKQHTQDAHEILNLNCGQCGKEFTKMYSFRNHWKRFHPEVPFGTKSENPQPLPPPPPPKKEPLLLKCTKDDCDYSTNQRGNLRRHMNTHVEKEQRSDLATCPYCNKLIIKDSLRGHIQIHLGKVQKKAPKVMTGPLLKCSHEGCTYSSQNKHNLKRHENCHLEIEDRPDVTICPECGIQLMEENLPKHMKVFHQTVDEGAIIKCPICDKKFLKSHNYRYEIHMKRHAGIKSVFCEQCGKGFVDLSSLTSHMSTVHQVDEILHSCQECSKEFTKKESYYKHWRNHHKEKPFPLLTTKRQLSRSSFYGDQLKAARQANKLMPKRKYPCEECNVVYGKKDILDRHNKRVHMKMSAGSSNRQRRIKVKLSE